MVNVTVISAKFGECDSDICWNSECDGVINWNGECNSNIGRDGECDSGIDWNGTCDIGITRNGIVTAVTEMWMWLLVTSAEMVNVTVASYVMGECDSCILWYGEFWQWHQPKCWTGGFVTGESAEIVNVSVTSAEIVNVTVTSDQVVDATGASAKMVTGVNDIDCNGGLDSGISWNGVYTSGIDFAKKF